MVVFQNSVMYKRRWFLRFSLLAVVLALIIGVVLTNAIQSSTVAAVQSSINSYSLVLAGLRLAVIGLIALVWPKLIHIAERSQRISEDAAAQLKSLRWRIVGWLLVIELLLGQNLVWRSLQALPWTDT